MSFLDVRFPVNISYGSSGGPEYSTTVTIDRGGSEYRNANWTYPKHSYDVAYGVKVQTDLEDLIAFFHVVRGGYRTFRYKDWADYQSCAVESTVARTDQTIGTGDASETAFQVYKTYTYSGNSRLSRIINKPVNGTVLVEVNGVLMTEGGGDDYTIDYSTGIITFAVAPGTGHLVKCGYQFDVHGGFDSDDLPISLDDYLLGSVSVNISEQKHAT